MISQPIKNKEVKNLSQLIEESREVVITCHVKPDGDAVGSSLALYHLLQALGKTVSVITPDTPPHYLNFLPGFKDIVVFSSNPNVAIELFERAGILFSLDYNAAYRVDKMEKTLRDTIATKVMIDHHLDPEPFADIVISHPEMSSTCLLLYKVICALGLRPLINRETAECLATGIMTDTGNLSYNANDPDIYIVMSELLRCGVDKVALWDRLSARSENQLRLNAYALLKKMEVLSKGRAALITLTKTELEEFHYRKGDTEGLVNVPLEMPDVKLSVFMHEEPDFIKVSMRSKGNVPVNEICERHFGGGGHMNAAGGEFRGSMEACVACLKNVLGDYIENSD